MLTQINQSKQDILHSIQILYRFFDNFSTELQITIFCGRTNFAHVQLATKAYFKSKNELTLL